MNNLKINIEGKFNLINIILIAFVLFIALVIGSFYIYTHNLDTETYIGVITEIKNDVNGGIFGSNEIGYIILNSTQINVYGNSTQINVYGVSNFNWEIGKKYKIITEQDVFYTYYNVKSIEKLD